MKKSKTKFIFKVIDKVNQMQNSKFWGLWFLALLTIFLLLANVINAIRGVA